MENTAYSASIVAKAWECPDEIKNALYVIAESIEENDDTLLNAIIEPLNRFKNEHREWKGFCGGFDSRIPSQYQFYDVLKMWGLHLRKSKLPFAVMTLLKFGMTDEVVRIVENLKM